MLPLDDSLIVEVEIPRRRSHSKFRNAGYNRNGRLRLHDFGDLEGELVYLNPDTLAQTDAGSTLLSRQVQTVGKRFSKRLTSSLTLFPV